MRLRRDPKSKRPADLKGSDHEEPIPRYHDNLSLEPEPNQFTAPPELQPKSVGTQILLSLQRWWKHGWLAVALLTVVTLITYGPCLHGDFVWDDDAWTLKLQALFQNLSGLGPIWTRLTALQQYYPLTA